MIEVVGTSSELGRRIKEKRLQRGWTISKLARTARVSHGYLSEIEAGVKSTPSAPIISRIAEALGTSADYLLGRTEDPSPPSDPELDQAVVERRYMNIPPPGWDKLTPEERQQAMEETREYEEMVIRRILRRRGQGGKG